MKHLKLYESIVNFEVKIFTSEEFTEFYYEKFATTNIEYRNGNQPYDLKNKIHYFDWDDLDRYDDNNKTKRFMVAYNDKDILGICKFAWFKLSGQYAVCYLSTNKDYFNQGISKRLLNELFDYFSKTYSNDTLTFTGYSIEGWKYLRKTILELSDKYNVKINEKAIEYVNDWTDEKRALFKKSRKIISDKYPDKHYYDYD